MLLIIQTAKPVVSHETDLLLSLAKQMNKTEQHTLTW